MAPDHGQIRVQPCLTCRCASSASFRSPPPRQAASPDQRIQRNEASSLDAREVNFKLSNRGIRFAVAMCVASSLIAASTVSRAEIPPGNIGCHSSTTPIEPLRLTANLEGGHRDVAVVDQREGGLLSGSLIGSSGAIPGAMLCIFSRVLSDDELNLMGIAVTRPDGSYRFASPPGPSRSFTFVSVTQRSPLDERSPQDTGETESPSPTQSGPQHRLCALLGSHPWTPQPTSYRGPTGLWRKAVVRLSAHQHPSRRSLFHALFLQPHGATDHLLHSGAGPGSPRLPIRGRQFARDPLAGTAS